MIQPPEMIDLRIPLSESISALLKHKEEQLEHEISSEEKHFLLSTITDGVLLRVHKYVAGSKEHGDGFLTNVDHLSEIQKELADLDFYVAGTLRKQQDFDKRYDS